MVIIAGCVIKRDNKILMVQEANPNCYGKWNIPAGHADETEQLTETAIREVYEETGCKVKLTGVLPIVKVDINGKSHFHVKFMADLIEENIKFDKKEILDVKWIDIEELKNMSDKELRGYEINSNHIRNAENNNVFPLEIFDTTKYVRK